MRTLVLAAIVAVLLAAAPAWGATNVVPTTTLTAETANNTSASSSWTNTSTGNAVPGNVSKLPLRSLLYAGATTKLWAHYMPWFGESWHIGVGYNSSDPAQAAATVNDMASRGFDGLIVDWYGPNAAENNATLVMRDTINARSDNFQFMIMEDAGALKKCSQTAGCNVTQQLISDITYIYNTFASSPHYYKENGRYVVPNFDVDSRYTIDWTLVRASVPGNPLFVFRNAGGFTKSYSDGGYAWIDPLGDTSTDPADLKYFSYFYPVALQNPGKVDLGSAYLGFNDNLASWGQNRIIVQQCGQTWLSTWAEVGKYFNATTQLPHLQVPTWNDYEEGTEIETGVDNCVAVSASTSGTVLNWSISGGQENTIHHYSVFISTDGENLMRVADVPAGTHALDLSSYAFAAGDYSLFVKAVGQASILNKMSARVSWSVAAPPPAPAATFSVTNSTAPQTVSAGQSASYSVSVTPSNGFTGSVNLTCTGAPQGSTCTATPDPASVTSGAVAVTVKVSTSGGKIASLRTSPSTYLAFWLWMPVGMVAAGNRRSRKFLAIAALTLVCGGLLLLQGCAGAGAQTETTTQAAARKGTPAGTYSITVQGVSGSQSSSAVLTLTVK